VLADTTPGYRLKPGRWAVDAVITVPANAPEGPYQVVVDFAGPVTFNRPVGLNVKR
jgi:hypothetical protein